MQDGRPHTQLGCTNVQNWIATSHLLEGGRSNTPTNREDELASPGSEPPVEGFQRYRYAGYAMHHLFAPIVEC